MSASRRNRLLHVPVTIRTASSVAVRRRLARPDEADLIHPNLVGSSAMVGDEERDAPGTVRRCCEVASRALRCFALVGRARFKGFGTCCR